MTNQVTGATAAALTGARLAVCVGAVVWRDDQALFVRQAPGHPLAGQWTVPWGMVEPGETPEHAALRETKEESGISMSSIQSRNRIAFPNAHLILNFFR